MRRRVALLVAVLMVPSGIAAGAELDEILEASRSATFSGEQLIACSTPDGSRDALIDIQQRDGLLHYGGIAPTGPEVWSGETGWVVRPDETAEAPPGDQVVTLATVPTYVVEDAADVVYLGRRAGEYILREGELVRAELTVDRATGVLLSVVTYDDEGNIYCERRFVSFRPSAPEWPADIPEPTGELVPSEESSLPETLAGFDRLDVYVDEAGLEFGYYSDGFFSFAVFESEVRIVLDGGVEYTSAEGVYNREFTPGQVTYAWSIEDGGMALIGDLPPDMHQEVLEGLPAPYDPGFFRRLWRSLFG